MALIVKTDVSRVIVAYFLPHRFDRGNTGPTTKLVTRFDRDIFSVRVDSWENLDGIFDVRRILCPTCIPAHACWIFTTTIDGQETFEGCEDSGPLMSRCLVFHLARRGVADAMAERLKAGAMEQGLDGQDIKQYVKLLYDCKLNMRAAWQRIEAGEMIV